MFKGFVLGLVATVIIAVDVAAVERGGYRFHEFEVAILAILL